MIIDLKRNIDLGWLFDLVLLFILRWSCCYTKLHKCMKYGTYTLSPSPIVSTDLKLLDLVADLSSQVVCTVHNRKMETHLVLTIVYPRFAKISKMFWSLLNSLTCRFHRCNVHTLNILEGEYKQFGYFYLFFLISRFIFRRNSSEISLRGWH